eukprot:1544805-Pyramimonas_sp.AAC.1
MRPSALGRLDRFLASSCRWRIAASSGPPRLGATFFPRPSPQAYTSRAFPSLPPRGAEQHA